jgi:protein-disulfide isomerase
MYAALYAKQDSLGLKTFREYASESGVSDLDAFERCNRSPGPVPVVEADRLEAEEHRFAGTPTVTIDGDLYSSTPDSAQLHRIVAHHLEKKARE